MRDLRQGDSSAAERLFPLVYEELRALAGSFFRGQPSGHTLQPTALVHEAYIRLVSRDDTDFKDERHFLAVAATAMRRVLLDHARGKRADKRGGGWKRITLDRAVALTADGEVDFLDLDAALTRLGERHERQVRVVELRFLGGLSVEETADVLGVSTRTVELDWRAARAWLHATLVAGREP